MKTVPCVWVVEMNVGTHTEPKWEPCATARLTKKSAGEECRAWRGDNLGSRFRIRKYIRSGE